MADEDAAKKKEKPMTFARKSKHSKIKNCQFCAWNRIKNI